MRRSSSAARRGRRSTPPPPPQSQLRRDGDDGTGYADGTSTLSTAIEPLVYILATPPPRPGYNIHTAPLAFQIQQLQGNRMMPMMDIKRPKKQVLTQLPLAAAPLRVRHAAARISVHDHQLPQFAGFPCDDGESKRSAVVHASGHTLRFRHSNGTVWRVRRDGASFVVYSSSRLEPNTHHVVGWWSKPDHAAKRDDSCWSFVAHGRVMATMRNARIEVSQYADLISHRGYVGCLRFEEALCLTAIFIAGVEVFGVPPEVDSQHPLSITQTESLTSTLSASMLRSHSTSTLLGLNHRLIPEQSTVPPLPSFDKMTTTTTKNSSSKTQHANEGKAAVISRHRSLPVGAGIDEVLMTLIGPAGLMTRGWSLLRRGSTTGRKASNVAVAH
ncbi:hypothetical protein BZA70DRAFT_128439 [Myxozyma melibiosi]|uniref:Uncharacterized protein n=1 Tax=Myxozyma melibiosi TaxID=54550 RepID=A0ABR1F8U1_9ASCO